LGAYKLALSLVNLVQMPVTPMPNATYPELARETARRNWGNVRHILRQGSLVAGGYTLAASIALLFLGQPFIRLAYTAEFLPAYPALLIMLLGFLAANTFYWNRVTLLAFGLPEYLTKVNFVAAIFKIIGYIILVPIFGYLGCAALLAAYYIFSSTVNVLKARQTLQGYEKQDVQSLSAGAV
jgi:O-antigen/teichoic acid export membrane protein